MLFARFLAENNLLMLIEDGEKPVAVSLDDCKELAKEAKSNLWTLAGRYAQTMLPEIFRSDDPVLQVPLAREDQIKLEELLDSLARDTFTASDSLGWCYQFWQAERKDEVNASGNKIGADELPAVTQLFTEDYMVDFLLDNTLGAWHAGKVLAAKPKLAENAQSEDELRNAVALPGCPWKYLRFIKAKDGKWTPAAGTFDGWPKTAKELKCLDPCMGSGTFRGGDVRAAGGACAWRRKSWTKRRRWRQSSATTCSVWRLTRAARRLARSIWRWRRGGAWGTASCRR